MIDLILCAIASLLIVCSPHPWVAICGGVVVWWAVAQRITWAFKGWKIK